MLKMHSVDDTQQFVDHVFGIFSKHDCNRIIREHLLENIYALPNRIIGKWENLIPNHNFDWADIFRMAFKCAIDLKTRNFQFKILHRIIATNDFLNKLDIIDNDRCTFCDMEIETLEHVFYNCNIIQDFWNRVIEWIKIKSECDICVSKVNIFLEYNIKNPRLAINYIILLGKQFINKCKLFKTTPKFHVFLFNIKEFIKIEYQIALSKNKVASHYLKWDGFL